MSTTLFLLPALFAPPPEFKPTDFEGFTLPAALKYSIGLSGGSATGYVLAFGCCGTFAGTRGLSKSADALFLDVDLSELGYDLVGKAGRVEVSVRGDKVRLLATKFATHGDWVQRAEAEIDLKLRRYVIVLHILGGTAKASGELPEWFGR